MKAVVWEGKPYSVSVKNVPKPTIQDPLDAIIKVQLTAICGTDLHTYCGHLAVQKGLILGHEIVGVVEEIGSGVQTSVLKKGDKVVVPCRNRVWLLLQLQPRRLWALSQCSSRR